MTKTQDEALRVLAALMRETKGPAADDAFLLIGAVRRGDADEQIARTADVASHLKVRVR